MYRYIQDGILNPYGKFLGDWLLKPEEVIRLERLPRWVKKVPWRFQVLFPEYSTKELNPCRDYTIILSRILDRGTREEVRWAFERYPREVITEFLERDGMRTISPRAFRFWSLYFGANPPVTTFWRLKGRQWGGAP